MIALTKKHRLFGLLALLAFLAVACAPLEDVTPPITGSEAVTVDVAPSSEVSAEDPVVNARGTVTDTNAVGLTYNSPLEVPSVDGSVPIDESVGQQDAASQDQSGNNPAPPSGVVSPPVGGTPPVGPPPSVTPESTAEIVPVLMHNIQGESGMCDEQYRLPSQDNSQWLIGPCPPQPAPTPTSESEGRWFHKYNHGPSTETCVEMYFANRPPEGQGWFPMRCPSP